jgi:hypothetical protein
MRLEEIKAIVTNNSAKPYRVSLIGSKPKIVRLWKAEDGRIAIMDKGRKKYGHELSSWYDHYDEWTNLRLVEHNGIDYHKRFVKRAKDALKMLNESGLWGDIKENIEHFFTLSDAEQKELVNDIITDSYELFYKQTWNDGKYAWVHCHQIFVSFAGKTCWKSIAWHKWERKRMSAEVADCIKNGKNFSERWINGYDNSVEVAVSDDGYKRAWYCEEYRTCSNGHYYLMFDATHAIFYEND